MKNVEPSVATGDAIMASAGYKKIIASIIQQIILYKQNSSIKLEVDVVLFSKAMTFIFCFEKPNICSVLFYCFSHLRRLGYGHTRIIAAGNNEQWLFYF